MVSCPHYVPLCSGSISHSIPLFPVLSHAIHAIPLYSKYCISHYFWYVPFSPHDLPDILRRSTTENMDLGATIAPHLFFDGDAQLGSGNAAGFHK